MNALMRSAAILGGVSKRDRSDDPAWRVRIAAAVSRHGKLKEIADAAEMTSPQLQKIANGSNQNPGVRTLERIAAAIGLTLSELTDPRPEEGSGRGRARGERNLLLEERFPILEALDNEAPAEDNWRGDVLKAIAALNRALRRPRDTSETHAFPQKAGR